MPTLRANGIEIYYEIHGEGDPLLLIGGLANDVTDYAGRSNIASLLAKTHTVIVFDNRGVGRTDKPDIPYSVEMMADDTWGLLQALGIAQANIVAVSMGGRIALELALRHPDAVRRLVLVSTGPTTMRNWRHSVGFQLHRLPFFQGKYRQPYYAFKRQAEASGAYDCTSRLNEICAPTLILHGRKDKLAPFDLAESMHRGIAGSKLIAFEGGHMFLFFRSREFVDATTHFLKEAELVASPIGPR